MQIENIVNKIIYILIIEFVKKRCASKHEPNLKQIRKSINIKRATELGGAFGKYKKYYNLNCINVRTVKTELLWIFFIQTSNAIEIGKRIRTKDVLKRALKNKY